MNKKKYKFLLALIFLTIPVVVNAHMGFERELFIVSIGFIVAVAFLITIFLLYLLRRKSHSLLLLIDIIFSATYAIMININFRTIDAELKIVPVYIAPSLVAFFVIFGIILFIKKKRGRDILALSRAYVHGIITGVITILFTLFFSYGAAWILYSTNCDMNLILNSYDREVQRYHCIVNTAVKKNDTEFCNKFGEDRYKAIRYCKMQVSIKMVELGDLSGCSYLTSSDVVSAYYYGFGREREKEFIDKCRE